jgi:hypothetical protein
MVQNLQFPDLTLVLKMQLSTKKYYLNLNPTLNKKKKEKMAY